MSEDLNVLADIDKVAEPTEAEYLSQLVGDGKKYANVDALAKAYLNAEKHINTVIGEKRSVEAERDALKASQMTLKEVIESIRQDASFSKPKDEEVVESKQLTPEELEALVEAKLEKKALAARSEAMKKQVWESLSAKYGSEANAKAVIKAYAGEDKAKLKLLDEMALTDFDGMVKLLGDKVPGSEVVSTENLPKRMMTPDVPKGLTWSVCEKIRKDNPSMYRSRLFQVEMHKASINNPDFFNK